MYKCDICEVENVSESTVTVIPIYKNVNVVICSSCYQNYKIGEPIQEISWKITFNDIRIRKLIEAFIILSNEKGVE